MLITSVGYRTTMWYLLLKRLIVDGLRDRRQTTFGITMQLSNFKRDDYMYALRIVCVNRQIPAIYYGDLRL